MDGELERAQRIVRERLGEGRTPSDELIRERREEAARGGKPGDKDPVLSLPDDPIDDRTLPADASTNLDRYLYGDGEPFGAGTRK